MSNQGQMPLETHLPSSLHLQLLPPFVFTPLAPAKSKAETDAKNLLLTSSAQIFEKSSHPPQEEGAGKRERGCPKLAWL